jgi:precorrin-2 dehydrogenase/sirohydrochlorin ferrochelatase
MKLLPAGIRVEGRLCVVIGSGARAVAAASELLRAGARVRLVAHRAPSGLDRACNIELVRGPFSPRHLAGALLAVAAASDETNRAAERAARRSGVLVVTPGSPGSGDLVIEPPAPPTRVLSRRRPTGADAVRLALGDEYAQLAKIIAAVRSRATKSIKNGARRRAFFESLADDSFLDIIRADGCAKALLRAEDLLGRAVSPKEA